MRNFFSISLVIFLFFGCSTQTEKIAKENKEVFASHQSEFLVKGMMCERGCTSYLDNKISKFNGVVNCDIDFTQEKLFVDYDNDILSSDKIISLVRQLNEGQYSLELLNDKVLNHIESKNKLSNSKEDDISVVDFGFQLPNLAHLFTNWL